MVFIIENVKALVMNAKNQKATTLRQEEMVT
jgi:hypothetical protein